jgi:hypothetical protein
VTASWQKVFDLIVRPAEYEPPTYALIAAGVVFLTLTVLAAPKAHAALEQLVSRLARWMRRVGCFPNDDVTVELLRLDLLRIILAGCLLYRFWPEFVLFRATGNLTSQMAAGTGLLLSGALLFGVATPVAGLALAFLLNLVLDFFSGNESLGSMVVANCLIPLAIAPAGTTISVDSVLLRARGTVGGLMRGLYALWGPPTLDRIQVGRFLALMAFGTITLYSAVKHLASPTWTNGAATGVILLSPIASPSWAPFSERFYQHAHTAYVLFSTVSTYGMLLWQLLLLPLVFLNRWTRRFAIVWGLLFFAFSTYVLHLKTLGVYEFVLWAIIFWNGQPVPAGVYRRVWARFDRRGDSIVPDVPFQSGLAAGIITSFAFLWGAFLVDCVLPLAPELVGRSHRRAPLVFGMGPVNVFNEVDLQLFRNHAIARRHEPSGSESRVSFRPSEAVDRALTLRLVQDVDEPVFCDPEFARMWFESYAQTLPAPDPDRASVFSMEFLSWTRPTNTELRSLRKIKIAWETMCTVTLDLHRPKALSITYFPAAVSRWPRPRDDSRADPAVTTNPPIWPTSVHELNLAGRFPCDLEVVSATNWSSTSRAASTKAVGTALRQMSSGQRRGPVPCLAGYRALVTELALVDGTDPNVNPTGTCESELAIAEFYNRALVDDPLQTMIAAHATSARAAAQRGDVAACRTAVGKVRDVYFRAVFSAVWFKNGLQR